ncbi:MAG: hypothetical protein AAGI09_07820 [Pseudomonadota bacterium]
MMFDFAWTTPIVVLSGALLGVLLIRAIWVVQDEERNPPERGSAPGVGYTKIEANYHSGGPGGGHSTIIRVPRDPQEYARSFVPHHAKGQDDE